MEGKKFFIIIAGPTAIGKSKIALFVAKSLDGEIINADSRQVYRFFIIGTGSPTEEEKKLLPHHLYNFYPPEKRFSAYLYMKEAEKRIREIYGRGKIPIVVGGTGLYIRSLIKGLFEEPETDENVRETIKKEAEKKGWDCMYEYLKKIDPIYAEKISKNDKIRITRAIEVYKKTGKPISKLFDETKPPLSDFYKLYIGIIDKKRKIHERIEKRVLKMVDEGLVEEVKHLIDMGYGPDTPAFQSIGYRHIYDYLNGKITIDTAKDLMVRDTKRYAKRQITWFKKEKGVHWHKPDEEAVLDFIKREIRWKKLCL